MTTMLGASLQELITGSLWTYVVVTGSIAGSAVFPPLPSESMLIAAMSLAVAGGLDLAVVGLVTTTGAVLGDSAAYALGRTLSRRARERATRSPRAESALRWLQAHEGSWGPGLILVGRFIPGGTTAVGVSAGLLAYPFRRFLLFAVLGAVLWAGYGLALVLMGRAAFPDGPWAGAALSIGIALAAGALFHAVRTRARTRTRRN